MCQFLSYDQSIQFAFIMHGRHLHPNYDVVVQCSSTLYYAAQVHCIHIQMNYSTLCRLLGKYWQTSMFVCVRSDCCKCYIIKHASRRLALRLLQFVFTTFSSVYIDTCFQPVAINIQQRSPGKVAPV